MKITFLRVNERTGISIFIFFERVLLQNCRNTYTHTLHKHTFKKIDSSCLSLSSALYTFIGGEYSVKFIQNNIIGPFQTMTYI